MVNSNKEGITKAKDQNLGLGYEKCSKKFTN